MWSCEFFFFFSQINQKIYDNKIGLVDSESETNEYLTLVGIPSSYSFKACLSLIQK